MSRQVEKYIWGVDHATRSDAVLFEGGIVRASVGSLALAAFFSVPSVVRLTGVRPIVACALFGALTTWCAFVYFVLRPRARTSRGAFRLAWIGNFSVNLGLACALPAAAGDPRSPLWVFAMTYAALNGTLGETRRSYVLLLGHTFAPLTTIPAFDGQPWAIAGPALYGALCGFSYHHIGTTVAHWRVLRREQEDAIAARDEELRLARLARDLHDSVGASLGLLALHADFLDRHADDPVQVRRLSGLARRAAHDGLDDLRGMLEAFAPPGEAAGTLVESLRELVTSQTAPSSVAATVRIEGDPQALLGSTERLVIVRVVQESVRNVVQHARAQRIDVVLRVSNAGIVLHVSDDGRGFDPNAAKPSSRGIAGMRARLAECNGSLEIESSVRGTCLIVSIPSREG
jgi:signal transduction histidine kinase